MRWVCFFLVFLFSLTTSAKRSISLRSFREFSRGNFTDFCLRRPHRGIPYSFSLIHVGKTGGTSLVSALTKAKFFFGSDFHLCAARPREVKDRPILMTIREPIARTLSIWRWRKFRCPGLKRCQESHEYFLIECFPYLEDFLNIRYNITTNSSLSEECLAMARANPVPLKHWQLGHRWHLHLLAKKTIDDQVFPVRQTNLINDFSAFCLTHLKREKCPQAVEILQNEHRNEEYPTTPKDYYLSEMARKHLIRELKGEIAMYNRLVTLLQKRLLNFTMENKIG